MKLFDRFAVSYWRAIDLVRMAGGERNNYIKQCWKTGRWMDGLQASVYPARYLVYRWYRDLISPAEKMKYRLCLQPQEEINFTTEIPDLFVGSVEELSELFGKEDLYFDVDRHADGIFRLAGGATLSLEKLLSGGVEDVEHLHAYHRLYWAVRYARGVFCGHVNAFQSLKHDLSSWMSHSWDGDIAVATPYTTSERIASLAEVLFWLKQAGLPDSMDMIAPIKQRMYLDSIHLQENLEVRDDFNNHILNNARALYIASRMLHDMSQAEVWEKQAFELWEKYFPKLVLEDGSFAEQTSFYHLQMCRTALEYVLASRQTGREIVPDLFQCLCRMFQQADDLLRSDGSLIRSGNTSPDHSVDNFWGMLSACYAHGLLPNPPRHKIITLLTLYYSTMVDGLQNEQEGKKVVLYHQGGWAFITDTNLDVDLAAHGDPRNETHHSGDAGRGTFELWWKNMILIREPGNPTYTLNARHWYRNASGQNVSSLNGVPPGISAEYQAYLPSWYFKCQNGEWELLGEQGVKYVSYGLSRLDVSIVLTRKWFWRDERKLAMEETISGDGNYQFASSLHLGDAPWRQEGTSTFACTLGDSQVLMKLFPPQNSKVKVVPSKYAPEYGVEKDGRTLSLVGKVKLPFTWSVEWEFRP
ncbi:MAG: heparinase II/III family protein [Anaerolineales bacterium]|nr:heparinase II/III family protein [Anaerolineales bacterium]